MAKDRLFFLLSLGLLGILAAFMFSKSEPPQQQQGLEAPKKVEEQIIKVLVAQRKLNPGTRLTRSTYQWEEIASEDVTPSYVLHNPELEKRMEEAVVVNSVSEGDKIKRLDIIWPQEEASRKSKLPALPLKSGMIAVHLGIGKNSPLFNYIKPGKNVDVVFHSDAAIGFGHESLALFKNIRILTIGSQLDYDERGGTNDSVEVLLEMTPREARVFNYARQAGSLSLELSEQGEKAGAKVQENEELIQQLLASNSSLKFNSILTTHMIRTLFPEVDVKITATPDGYIATGNIKDPRVADKITEVLAKLSEKSKKAFVDLMETDDGSVPVEEGKVSVLLHLQEMPGIAHFMKPGMKIDLIFTSKSASGFGVLTLPLLKNIRVLSIGRPGRNGHALPPEGPIDILLEMSPHEANVFSYAQQAGKLSVGLTQDRRHTEAGSSPEEEKELRELRGLLLTTKDDGTFNSILATYMIRKLFPRVDVTVTSTPKGFIASGKVNEPQVAEKIREILIKLSDEGEKNFIDLMKVVPQQVLICVRVLEVARDIKTRLGINWKALYENADYTVALAAIFPRPPVTDPNYVFEADNVRAGNFTLDTIIDMLKTDGRGKVLAEPNLTTVSGQPAHFFSGGEFPILIPQGGNLVGTVTVEYKKFGVILDFTPYVDLNGLISLHIVPEVSSIDEQNAVTLQGFNVPSLISRRVDTTVKLWPGQCYAIAGLMQYDTITQFTSLYNLDRLPIIGPLFRSKEFRERRTELMFLITPYLIYSDEAENYSNCFDECCAPAPCYPAETAWEDPNADYFYYE